MFNDFVKKQEAADRAVLIQSPDFYLDCLKKSDFKKVLADVDNKIKALKRESEESTKIEFDRIKTFQELMSSPDEHLKSMKDTSDKLLSAERQVQAEAEAKRVLIAQQKFMKEDSERQLQAEAEAKRVLIA